VVTRGATALIVGFGSIARRHIESLRAIAEGAQIVVLRPGGKPAGASADISFVETVGKALAARPSFAVIASPSASHIESLLPLLQAGVPCYVEKPPVTSRGDIEKLRALKSLPVTLTGCNLRFLPSLQRLRKELRSGAIGTPVRASLQAGQWLPDWRPGTDYRKSYSASRERGGGVILDLIHEIDAARWLFGEFDEVLAVSAKSSRLEIDSEDSAAIVLGGRPVVAIGLDYVARPPIRRYEIFGDEGTLTWDLPARKLLRGAEVLDGDPAHFDVAATYRAAMQEFVSAVYAARPTTQDLLDGLRSNDLALRAKGAP
jgi:predicted dehydrogenase